MIDDGRNSSSKKLQGKNCYVCGSENPHGLKIPFYFEKSAVRAEFSPGSDLCGFDGIVHGGILFSLADESMMHLIRASGLKALTAEVTMRYHSYAKTGEPLKIQARLEDAGRHLIMAQCIISDKSGKKIATARGKFLPIPEDDEGLFKKQF